MDAPKPKKFQTIAQFLEQNQIDKKKVTVNNGKLSVSSEIVKWSEEEDSLLLDLLKKRTLSAIRRRLWDLLHRRNGHTNQKLK